MDETNFARVTCGVNRTQSDFVEFNQGCAALSNHVIDKLKQNYILHSSAWRQGVLQQLESMSQLKPSNGWFVPNCGDGGVRALLGEEGAEQRRSVRIQLFGGEGTVNLLQVGIISRLMGLK